MSMTTRAAVCREPGRPWEITELELDDPQANEVRIKFMAAGLCHSDDHMQNGRRAGALPGGRRPRGRRDRRGGRARASPGSRSATTSSAPSSRPAASAGTAPPGTQNLCDEGANASTGDAARRHVPLPRERRGPRRHVRARHVLPSTPWSASTPCMPIPDDIPLEMAALVGCGVPTGWGSAVYAAGVRAGETVVVFGAGGVGSNAVQGARFAGAQHVVVVDPVEFKREKAKEFGRDAHLRHRRGGPRVRQRDHLGRARRPRDHHGRRAARRGHRRRRRGRSARPGR